MERIPVEPVAERFLEAGAQGRVDGGLLEIERAGRITLAKLAALRVTQLPVAEVSGELPHVHAAAAEGRLALLAERRLVGLDHDVGHVHLGAPDRALDPGVARPRRRVAELLVQIERQLLSEDAAHDGVVQPEVFHAADAVALRELVGIDLEVGQRLRRPGPARGLTHQLDLHLAEVCRVPVLARRGHEQAIDEGRVTPVAPTRRVDVAEPEDGPREATAAGSARSCARAARRSPRSSSGCRPRGARPRRVPRARCRRAAGRHPALRRRRRAPASTSPVGSGSFGTPASGSAPPGGVAGPPPLP